MKNGLFYFLLLLTFTLTANPGDTTHVKSHNQVTVVTDPNTGANGYKAWAVFPSNSLSVRKVIATLSYKCAPGMACGAWDYIDNVFIRRTGGQNQPSKNIEAVRFITPYGNQFSSTWTFSWHMDITDYAMFLRDSVEIEYIHTGYEGTNVGWQVTVDFAFIEGTPIANQINFTQLWNGSFIYGNATNSIENYLTPDTIPIDAACNFSKLRILHTGHGADANDCSEFCNKYRTLKIDGNIINTRARWRPCGNNALFPQGGTWVYDRGNWCPGNIVQPDFTMSTNLTPGTDHIFDMDMQPYVVSSPSANEVINAQLFQYATPNNSLDASIEEVYQPSRINEYIRLNPICTNPLILVRNNGSVPLNSVTIKYGLAGAGFQSYTWNGVLNFGDTTSITLPNFILPATTTSNALFKCYIESVNSQANQYTFDDSASVKLTSLPPVLDTIFIILFRTNNYLENSYYLNDASGNTVFSRVSTNLTPNTTYFDTVRLQPGCYDLSMYDTGGDGLSFWANTAQGSGLYRLKKVGAPTSVYFKLFGLDFGNFIKYQFTAVPHTFAVSVPNIESVNTFEMKIFPNPTGDKTTLEYICPQNTKPVVSLIDALGRIVKQVNLPENNDLYVLDLTDLKSGFYWVKLQTEMGSLIKKIIKE